jgi:hypothetical protein
VTGNIILYIRAFGIRGPRSSVIAGAIASAVVVPLALELAGVLPASYEFADGAMIVRSSVIDLAPSWTIPVMVGLFLVNVAVAASIAEANRREHNETGLRLRNQAWHLGQLVGRPGGGTAHAAGGGSASMRSSSPERSRSRRSE